MCSSGFAGEPTSARLNGGAGTGKTTELVNIVQKVVAKLGSPYDVGFVSFTRQARKEAADRTGEVYGIKGEKLQTDGWFRTLHSTAYRCIRAGKELLTDNVESRQWLSEALGTPISVRGSIDGESAIENPFDTGESDEDRALAIWDFARSTLRPVVKTDSDDGVWFLAHRADAHTPSQSEVCKVIERYEMAKRVSGRMDFTDLLSRFAGIHHTLDGYTRCAPEGEAPDVGAWILDEAQDTSPLAGEVFRRLVHHPSVKWTYLAGDYFQSIYLFGGADPRVFREWPVVAERTSPKSWRCPKPILECGEKILKNARDYFDRGIQPADHPGNVEHSHDWRHEVELVRPDAPWLILTRAKYLTGHVAAILNKSGVPWLDTHGGGSTWAAPSRNTACFCLRSIERGEPFLVDEWCEVLKHVPLGREGEGQFLVRGTKAKFHKMKPDEMKQIGRDGGLVGDEVLQVGATPVLLDLIKSGRWRSEGHVIVPHAHDWGRAVNRWGVEAVLRPVVRVGTIHSAKGAESENVLLVAATTPRCEKTARASQENRNAEYRVWYVGATRARKRLIVAKDRDIRKNTTFL